MWLAALGSAHVPLPGTSFAVRSRPDDLGGGMFWAWRRRGGRRGGCETVLDDHDAEHVLRAVGSDTQEPSPFPGAGGPCAARLDDRVLVSGLGAGDIEPGASLVARLVTAGIAVEPVRAAVLVNTLEVLTAAVFRVGPAVTHNPVALTGVPKWALTGVLGHGAPRVLLPGPRLARERDAAPDRATRRPHNACRTRAK